MSLLTTQLFRTKVQEMLVDILILLVYTNSTYSCNTRKFPRFLLRSLLDSARETAEKRSCNEWFMNVIERTL